MLERCTLSPIRCASPVPWGITLRTLVGIVAVVRGTSARVSNPSMNFRSGAISRVRTLRANERTVVLRLRLGRLRRLLLILLNAIAPFLYVGLSLDLI
ncbi:MAG: hypothetical protein [Geminiviridae sp.]|nr:MAG: hypothetical protein [Geminiviridae sp.]